MIFVHRGDSLTDVTSRILSSPEREVEVVIPQVFEALRAEEDLFRLLEECRAAGKAVRILTEDDHLRRAAKHVGFLVGMTHTAKRVMMSDIVRKPSSITQTPPVEAPKEVASEVSKKPISETSQEPPLVGEPILEPPSALRLPSLSLPPIIAPAFRFFRSSVGLTVGLVVVGLVLAAGVLAIVLPSVSVEVVPRTETLTLSMSQAAAVNPEEGEIPAQLVTVEHSYTVEVAASGRATVEAKATGTVTIYNRHSAESQTLVATTRLLSESGKLFRTTETVVVPGAQVSGNNIVKEGSVNVPVVAAEAGPDYNIGPSTFSIPGFQGSPKFQNFYGKSTEPMRGGALGDATVVEEKDVEAAETQVSQEADAGIEAEFLEKLPAGFVVVEEARVKTIVITTDVAPGQSAEKVVAEAQAKIVGLLFREEDIKARAKQAIEERLSVPIDIVEGSLKLSYSVSERSFEKGRMTLAVEVEAEAARKIDVDALKEAIAGKKEPEIRAYLAAHEDIEFAKVKFTPFFVSRAPKDPDRIEVQISLDTK